MVHDNNELLQRLLATFRIEADEHLTAIAACLMALEKSPAASEIAALIEKTFREVHSLKGAARAVNHVPIASLCQSLESTMSAMKAGRLQPALPLLDLLHRAIDSIAGMLAQREKSPVLLSADSSAIQRALDETVQALSLNAPETISPQSSAPLRPQQAESADATPDYFGPASAATVRVYTSKLDTMMHQAEELLVSRLAMHQRAIELHALVTDVSHLKKGWNQLRPTTRRLEKAAQLNDSARNVPTSWQDISKLLNYLEDIQLHIAAIEDRLILLSRFAAHDQHELNQISEDLLNEARGMQLLPFSSLLDRLPRIVRDLSREEGKEIDLRIQGDNIEIDRRILDELMDPLIHLLRNAVDHGIEKPAVRTASGKQARGTISLNITSPIGGKIELILSDDGAGIDCERVRSVATKLGILDPETLHSLDDKHLLDCVFHSGFSTSPIVTDLSGRGLGLAIVREKIEKMGGSISLDSRVGEGTRFCVALPLTLAAMRGLLVRLGERQYALPLTGIERAARVPRTNIRTVENRDTIVIGKEVVAYAKLGAVLELPDSSPDQVENDSTSVVVLSRQDDKVAFQVDDIIGEQEVLLKNLGPQLPKVRNVAGASVLGTGEVIPVLNILDLLKSATSRAPASSRQPMAPHPGQATNRSVLVAEDSITSRSLLKAILESAGYSVTTAVDGMDAFTTLKTGRFDLLISDVEMPRLDGFDLTARIRADKQLAELPVILVTALETRAHRERGIDVGANAYIAKSSFDQSNLLETIRRLI